MSMIEAQAKKPHAIIAFKEQLEVRESEFKAALPAHIPAERFNRIVMTAVQNNLKLLDADRRSFWNAAMKCAQDGLLPDNREAAFVLFQNSVNTGKKDGKGPDIWVKMLAVQYMPMIAGIRKKVRNSGEITSWESQVVYAKDHFEFELGDDPFIKHKPYMDGEPGQVVAAYSVAVLKGGEKSREVMTRAQLDKVRSVSKSKDSGPWVTWFDEMCRKTVARRHAKVLPMSTDLDDLIRRDDNLYDFSNGKDGAALPAHGHRTLASRLDAVAAPTPAHDPETGEIDAMHGDDAEEPAPQGAHEAAAPASSAPSSGLDVTCSEDDDLPGDTLIQNGQARAVQGVGALNRWLGGLSEKDHASIKMNIAGWHTVATKADGRA